jgi:hypothetical protein
MKNILIALVLLLSLPLMAADFKCSTESSGFGGWLDFSSTLEGKMKISGNSVTITQYDFNYVALDGDYAWSEAKVENAGPVTNNPNYRPRTYKNHLQFDISKGIFGTVKLLMPQKAFKSQDDFSVTLIMSWIEDHAGDSVSLECQWI